MKFLLDESLPLRSADALRRAGIDAVHVLELRIQGTSDEALLERAKLDRSVIIAFDSDFHRLMAQSGQVAPSVIRLRLQREDFEAVADAVRRVTESCRDALQQGSLISVTEEAIRIRRLPIRG